MSRDLNADLLAEVTANSLRPVIFVDLELRNTVTLVTSHLYLWTGYGTVTWDGQSWIGAGTMLTVDGIEETADSGSVGFKVQLNGFKASNIALALGGNKSRYLPGIIYLAAVKSDGTFTDGYLSRAGKLDRVEIDDQGQTCIITAYYEDENVALLKADDRRFTPEDQALIDADDIGFEQVAALQDMVIAF